MQGFIELYSSRNNRHFLLAVSNITSVANDTLGPGSVLNLQHSVDMHGFTIHMDLSLAKVKVLLEQAQQ